jgi:hypothetical protein
MKGVRIYIESDVSKYFPQWKSRVWNLSFLRQGTVGNRKEPQGTWKDANFGVTKPAAFVLKRLDATP